MNDCLWISPGFVFVVCAATEELMIYLNFHQSQNGAEKGVSSPSLQKLIPRVTFENLLCINTEDQYDANSQQTVVSKCFRLCSGH